MKTNSKAFRSNVQSHILNAIYDYDGPGDGRAAYIWNKFQAEYNYPDNRRRIPNTQERVAEWLSGLPLNVAYTYSDIIALSESWHGEKHSEKQADRVCENWFNLMAFNLLAIWAAAGIDPHA